MSKSKKQRAIKIPIGNGVVFQIGKDKNSEWMTRWFCYDRLVRAHHSRRLVSVLRDAWETAGELTRSCYQWR